MQALLATRYMNVYVLVARGSCIHLLHFLDLMVQEPWWRREPRCQVWWGGAPEEHWGGE